MQAIPLSARDRQNRLRHVLRALRTLCRAQRHRINEPDAPVHELSKCVLGSCLSVVAEQFDAFGHAGQTSNSSERRNRTKFLRGYRVLVEPLR